jgi:D-tyrosyl-tRNA(Tyr) deacylase
MKALVQRVVRGRVRVGGQEVGAIGKGYVVLLGVRQGDTEEDARYLAHRTVGLRVFDDAAGKMNLDIEAARGSVLVVSQFTLYADTRKGNRPGFTDAAPPDRADALYRVYVEALQRALGEQRVACGVFRAAMEVEIVNDGPVTVELLSEGRTRAKETGVGPAVDR